jgi:hypothetical protein
MEHATDSDPDTPPPSGASDETGSDAPEDPGNELYSSDWSDDWDEAYLKQREAHALRTIDPHLDACYHAVFGVAAWDAALAANLQECPAFRRAQWAPKTLQEFFGKFGHVLRLFHAHNFIEEYEQAYARAKGVRVDFLAPTALPGHVNTRLAVRRLRCLDTAIHTRGSAFVAGVVDRLMLAHAAHPPALDSAINDYLRHYETREPFDNADAWANGNAGPVAGHDQDEHGADPALSPRPRPAHPPSPAAPPRAPRGRPSPSLPERALLGGDPRLAALLARMQALYPVHRE